MHTRTLRVNCYSWGGRVRAGREQNLSKYSWADKLKLIHSQLRHIREPKDIQEIWGRQTLHSFEKLVKQKIFKKWIKLYVEMRHVAVVIVDRLSSWALPQRSWGDLPRCLLMLVLGGRWWALKSSPSLSWRVNCYPHKTSKCPKENVQPWSWFIKNPTVFVFSPLRSFQKARKVKLLRRLLNLKLKTILWLLV